LPKIPCTIRAIVGRRPFPFVTFFLRTTHISRFVDALVDTGSPYTVLSTNEVMSTRMPITKMRLGEIVSLAGFHFFNYPIKNVEMSFRTETDELFKVKLESIGSLIPTKLNKKTLDEVKNIPSIIGNDFLESQKLALYFNPSKRIAYLEY